MTATVCMFWALLVNKDTVPSPRPEVLGGCNRRVNEPAPLWEGKTSCKGCGLLGNGYFIFWICASNGPCQSAFSHRTLSATVFDRLHCKEAACNSLFVPVYILDCFLVTLLFWFWGEYLIDIPIFLEIILFLGSYVKSNQYLYFVQTEHDNFSSTYLTL